MYIKKTNIAPTAIVIDDFSPDLEALELRNNGKLSWLFAGKPLACHVIEELAQIGVKNCFILTNTKAAKLSASIMDVYRWDNRMNIEILNYTLDRDAVLRAFNALANPNGLLIVESNKIRSRLLSRFLDKALLTPGDCVVATSGIEELGITFLKPNSESNPDRVAIDLVDAKYQSLNDCTDFTFANFRVLSGNLLGLYPRIAPTVSAQLWKHNRTSIHRSTTLQNEVFIERGGRVERSCRLRKVLLNSHAFVGKGSNLDNVIVMPGGFVPKNSLVSNAIISGNEIVSLRA